MRTDKTEIAAMAGEIVRKVLEIGDTAHPDEDWTKPTITENVGHGSAHFGNWVAGMGEPEEELEHALCRAAMALYRFKKQARR